MPTFSTLHSFLFHIMNLPFSTSSTAGMVVAAVLGLLFGILLQKGRVTDYTVIVNLFRLRDWTVLRIMLTAILVGWRADRPIGASTTPRGASGWPHTRATY